MNRIKKIISDFFERVSSGGYTIEEMGAAAGGGKGSSQRPVTEEERALWDMQTQQLESLMTIAEDQNALAKEDREQYIDAFRNAEDPQAQSLIADLQEKLTGERPEGNITTDVLLRNVLIGSSGKMQEATKEFVALQEQQFADYKGELSGLSQDYVGKLQEVSKGYEDEIQKTKDAMGTIDQGILSRETGAATAGISTAFSQAEKQLESSLARRGLAGTGVEASALGGLYSQQAQATAGAMGQARMQSLGLSDQLRMQKLGLAGQQAQSAMGTAQNVYGVQAGVSGQLYGQGAALGAQGYNLNIASAQQGIANLQSLNAAGQGLYVGSQNYLQQAAGNYAQGAQIAGQSATSLGQMQNTYSANQQAASSEMFGSVLGGVAGVATGGLSAAGKIAAAGGTATGFLGLFS